jgi:tetratricopeptide (TPR) repeat protein
MAAKDYRAALAWQPSNPDARLALARVTAKTNYDDRQWLAAWQLNRSAPRLFIDWGQALETDGQYDRARAMYQEARRLNPNWRMSHYALGKLDASQGRHEQALANYNEAIRCDSSFHLAYRDRAASCLAGKHKSDAATTALSSARRACELCYFRDAESLAVLAQSLAALEQWPDASRFQQMAVEYAPLSAKARHKQQFFEYWNRSAPLLASNDTSSGNGEVHRGFDPEDTSPEVTRAPVRKPRRLPPAFIDRSSQSFE